MTKEHERAALEVLRLLLVLASRSMYIQPGECGNAFQLRQMMLLTAGAGIVADTDVKALTYMTSEVDRETVLPLLCSLLNTVRAFGNASPLQPIQSHCVVASPSSDALC